MDGSHRDTGYFLNEFYEPFKALERAGYEIVIATPQGQPPALDPESLKKKYWKDHPQAREEALAFIETHADLQKPLSIQQALANVRDTSLTQGYQAVMVPGGQGIMVDLLEDPNVHELIRLFGKADKPVGLICHAPAILTKIDDNPFGARKVTSVSGIEEWYIETFVMGADAQYRKIGRKLDDAGMRYASGFPGRSHVVRDCNLVTSQNPFSGKEFNQLFLQAIEDWRRGGRCKP